MFICRVWNVSLRFYREAAISRVRLSAVVAARMMRAVGLGVRADVRAVGLGVRADVRAVGLVVRADVLAGVVSSVGGTMMVATMLMMARTLGHGDRGRGNDSDECKYLVHVCIS
ncbi:MAG: hypothetical protein IKJ29_10175 [Akkermansia sp.]|nr:hypothetical protein [Akkermansia sp.]